MTDLVIRQLQTGEDELFVSMPEPALAGPAWPAWTTVRSPASACSCASVIGARMRSALWVRLTHDSSSAGLG
jgi:hypothetical protein